jgi:hypothetical protein
MVPFTLLQGIRYLDPTCSITPPVKERRKKEEKKRRSSFLFLD